MFKIPENNDIGNLMNEQQKYILCKAIDEFAINYCSNNRLPECIKDSVKLDKYLDIKFNLEHSTKLVKKLIEETELENNNLSESINKYKFTQSLPSLSPHELDDKLWKQHIEKRKLNEETRQMMATVAIFCHKCRETKCRSYQLQTKSIDEPMTTFVACMVCGHNWNY
jgi:DNA-directed RNA polymerase subunit M/transcription elongation factor TFIIS